MEKTDLAALAKKGDKNAFAKLYAQYRDRLFRYALYKLQNEQDACDAVSDCVLEAFRSIKNLKNEKAFSAWIFKILYRSCCKTIANRAQNPENIENHLSDVSFTEDFRRAELSEALDVLSDEEREIVLLSAAAGFTSVEIAKLLGSNPSTVRSKLSRGLKKMRDFLE